MKLLSATIFIMLALSATANELSCKSELRKYSIQSKGYFYICHEDNDAIKFKAMAFGNSGQQCGAVGVATPKEGSYIYKAQNCVMSFTLTQDKLVAEFNNCWQGYCGMNANWHNGEYVKENF